jgi:hypothetical protein
MSARWIWKSEHLRTSPDFCRQSEAFPTLVRRSRESMCIAMLVLVWLRNKRRNIFRIGGPWSRRFVREARAKTRESSASGQYLCDLHKGRL